MDLQQNFSQLSLTWKTLIVIGSISTVIFLILLLIIVSLMFESKQKKETNDLSEYDDFLNEFTNGKENEEKNNEENNESNNYPTLPKIKDFEGNILKNLMQIDII